MLQQVVAKATSAAEARYIGMALAKAGNDVEARDNLTRAVDSGVKFSGPGGTWASLQKLGRAPASSRSEFLNASRRRTQPDVAAFAFAFTASM